MGTSFRDCADCPTMIVVNGGEFLMGSPPSEHGRFDDEDPQHMVTIVHPFVVSRAPITRAEYEAFVRATRRGDASSCASIESGEWVSTPGLTWRNPGFEQEPDHPVVCVSWDDAQSYVQWLSEKTGKTYRLLSEAEFEYVARAGTATAYPWGDSSDDICAHANSFDLAAKRAHPDWPAAECDDGYSYTAPANAFPANGFGLYGATGNVFSGWKTVSLKAGIPVHHSTGRHGRWKVATCA